jgi:hypothetical protein
MAIRFICKDGFLKEKLLVIAFRSTGAFGNGRIYGDVPTRSAEPN